MNTARQQLRTVYDSETLNDPVSNETARGIQVGGSRGSVPLSTAEETTTAPYHEAAGEPGLMLPRIKIDIFVTSERLLTTVQRVAHDRRALRSEFAVHRGRFAEAMGRYCEHASPDLVVIEDAGTPDELERQIEALAGLCLPSTRLIVIGELNDIALYRSLIKMGVSDYLVQPVTPLTLLDSISRIFTEDEPKDLGLVVAFLGARGGVGSSTVAHNAAAILSRRFDAATLLIDADIGFGTAALQFDITSPYGLADALKEREDLDGEVLEKLVHWRDKRMGILTAPDRQEQMNMPDPGLMRHVIDQARRVAKYVVLDLPHGWAPHTAEAIAAADRVVVVASPDLPSLRNTRTLLDLVKKVRPNDEPAQLILNRMPVRGRPAVSEEDFIQILDHKIGAVLPYDNAAASSEMAGNVLAEAMPGSEIVRGIETFIIEVLGREPAKGRAASKSLLGRFLSRK